MSAAASDIEHTWNTSISSQSQLPFADCGEKYFARGEKRHANGGVEMD